MVELSDTKMIVFYGSLMRGLGGRKKVDIENDILFVSECHVKGILYDLGEYPGLLPEGDNLIKAELYEILNLEVLETLDDFEGHNIESPELSFFRRVLIKLENEEISAYIYYYNDSVEGAYEVHGGNWRTHIMAK